VPDGQPAPLSPLSYVPEPYVPGPHDVDQIGLSINYSVWLPYSYAVGKPPVLFMGLTPGAVGLHQVNFILPQGLPAGNATMAVGELYCVEAGFPVCGAPSSWRHYVGAPVLIPVR
jgi:hypothetical protein